MAVVAFAAVGLCADPVPPRPVEAARAQFRAAQEALAAQRYDEAAQGFEAVLARDPSLASGHANLGVARYLLGQYDRAVESFRRALEASPGMPSVELYLGLASAKAGEMEEALPALSKGFWNAASDPWRLEGGMLLAQLHSSRGREDDVLRVVRELRRAYPSDPDVIYLAYRLHSDLGARAIADLVREAPGSARLHQVTAELLASEADYPRAARQYREALNVDANLPGARRGLALAILNSNPDAAALAEAERALREELALNPQDAEAIYQLGEICWRRGQPAAVREQYEQAVALQPRFTAGAVALAKALISDGEPERAAELLGEALRVDPENEVAHYRLAQAYRRLGRFEEAAAALEEFRRIRGAAEALGAIYRQVQRSTVTEQGIGGAASR